MKFYGKGKQSFSDADGVFLSVRFVDGVYETTDKMEIELLKSAKNVRTRKVGKNGSQSKVHG